jgi:hypothetical protein
MLRTARRKHKITYTNNVPCTLLSLVGIEIIQRKFVKVFYIEFQRNLCGYMEKSLCCLLQTGPYYILV